MKKVMWTDPDGYKHCSLLRDDDDVNKPQYGIPVGPPDISLIDWEDLKREVNNLLVQNEIGTYTELTQHPVVMPVLASLLKRFVAAVYKEYAGR